MVDQTRRARLAEFGLSTVLSDSTISNLYTRGDIIRWTSPELLDPETQGHHPTKYSDCYGLGMVIYEVLSRHVPFYRCKNLAIFQKVMQGDRPERPGGAEGVWLTDGIWEILERCWVSTPQNRPGVDDVLLRLENVSRSWISPPPDRPHASMPTTGSFARRPSNQNSTMRAYASGTSRVESMLQLDVSSPHFPEQLSGVLARSDFDESLQRLAADDLAPVIETLDKVLSFH